jgi:hypothetical protein
LSASESHNNTLARFWSVAQDYLFHFLCWMIQPHSVSVRTLFLAKVTWSSRWTNMHWVAVMG